MTDLDFVTWLMGEMRSAGIRFALTSGQACVHYGIQQTTKDSDWIVHVEDVGKLRSLLMSWDQGAACSVSYRSICGAPLDRDYLGHGWTSHLTVVDGATVEHHVDVFGKPPRVERVETDSGQTEVASRHVVAQMKKTDRDKDWPIVFGLGRQMLEGGDWRGVLHLQDVEPLVRAWPDVAEELRGDLIARRPLLALVEKSPQRLRRAIAIERAVWVAVNHARYTCYQRAWKEFFRRWRAEAGMRWPLAAPFSRQHEILEAACVEHRLPHNPFDERDRRAAYAQALTETAEIMAATPAELEAITPPLEVLLP